MSVRRRRARVTCFLRSAPPAVRWRAGFPGLFKARGYNRVITPTLEFFDVFDRESAGMPLETLYNITDSHGRLMVLRPDNTLPIARIAATRLREEAIPLRLFYSQNVFRRNRADRPPG